MLAQQMMPIAHPICDVHRAFELFEYEASASSNSHATRSSHPNLYTQRVVLRDIDMLLLHNVDDLLELDLPSDFIAASHACACNPRRFPHYPPDWCGNDCYNLEMELLQLTH